MLKLIRMTRNGISYNQKGASVYLDPKRAISRGISFISHAHMDHLHNQNGGTIITSKETSEIAKLRGYKIDNFVESRNSFSMIDSGHILGSRGLLFDDVFYTGDICTRKRGFLKGAEIPKCKTLITECTFGLPEFIFPEIEETVKKVNGVISEMYDRGTPVLLLGYELGKAQTLSHLFGHWSPLYYHDSIKRMNDLHRTLGVHLKNAIGHTQAEKKGLLEKKPWVMVAPYMSETTPFIRKMKSKYGAVTISFSGWAQSSKFKFGRRHDYSFPLSDHCGYDDLIDMVKKTMAEKIYTVHGFVNEFAADLCKQGFDAQPLREVSLDDYS